MQEFLDQDFLLQSKPSQQLYHEFAAGMPILDYHCHLPVEQIAADIRFDNLTRIWLNGDHYKWRAMRAAGVDEHFITGKAGDYEKFQMWADTVPYTLRNPLYHWTHLELRRYFSVDEILSPKTSRKIYDACTELLQTKEYSVRNLLRKMHVEVVCTTDDPVDSLEYHRKLREDGFEIKVLPAFRPDQAISFGDVGDFLNYLQKLSAVSGKEIGSYSCYVEALRQRHDYFGLMGCRTSDHGLAFLYSVEYSDAEVEKAFQRILSGRALSINEQLQIQSALLFEMAKWDHEKGWVQQFHLGAFRNNNPRLLQQYGNDAGCDSIGDYSQGQALSRFMGRLEQEGRLARTILYNLNPADNELFATMAGNFQDGKIAGKIQYGSAWWFLDQKEGMIRQMNTLSQMGLLSKFVGMVTDSRSFLSYPRHEYFRRILCNLIGMDIAQGELPAEMEWCGKLVQDICYYNAKEYFGWQTL